MPNDYDYISVSTDSELMAAFSKVMSESTNQEIRLEMSVIGLSHYSAMSEIIKRICGENTEIYKLVNDQIEKTRTEDMRTLSMTLSYDDVELIGDYAAFGNSF